MKLYAPRLSRSLLAQGASTRAGMFALSMPCLTDPRPVAG